MPLQPGLSQRHLCVPRQHLEGGSFPGTVHPQEAKALRGQSGVTSSPGLARSAVCLSVCPSVPHLPRGNGHAEPVHGRSLPAPVHLRGGQVALGAPSWHCQGFWGVWSSQQGPAPRSHLGEVLQQQEVALWGDAAHPRPLPGHVPVLVPQRGQLQSPWPVGTVTRAHSGLPTPLSTPRALLSRPVLTSGAGRSGGTAARG